MKKFFLPWIKEERVDLRRSQLRQRQAVLLALLVLTPLMVMELIRRGVDVNNKRLNELKDSTAQSSPSQKWLQGKADDWTRRTEFLDYLRKKTPEGYIRLNEASKRVEPGVMLLLFSSTGDLLFKTNRLSNGGLDDPLLKNCATGQLKLLPKRGVTRQFFCRDSRNQVFKGVVRPVGVKPANEAPWGQLVYLTPFAPDGSLLKSPDAEVVEGTMRSLVDDLPLMLVLLAALLTFRMVMMLERRRVMVLQRHREHQAGLRIRRSSERLDHMLERLGASDGSRGLAVEDEVTSIIFGVNKQAPLEQEASAPKTDGMEHKLGVVAKRFEQFLESARALALLDSLTDLPNRRYFLVRLEIEAQRAKRSGKPYAVMFVDIDKFKQINDTYGHGVGDAALSTVADNLREWCRREDFVARYGGDEFAVLMDLSGLEDRSESNLKAKAYLFANRLISRFEAPFELGAVSLPIRLSIGITIVQGGDTDFRQAMKRSDVAMYQAKKQFHSRIFVFGEEALREELDDYQLFADLQKALENHELAVFFQPILSTNGGIHTVEALARWTHPTEGDVSPETFLALAERYRLIGPLGEELLHLAVKGFATLLASMNSDLRLAINVTASLLNNPDFALMLLQMLSKQRVLPTQVTLEITETSLFQTDSATEDNLRILRDSGMDLSLDDFGTGYSSLNRLFLVQPNEIKIDKSFVKDLDTDATAMRIVKLITGLATLMKIRVVAEGVETNEIADLLSELGVHHHQGYLYSKARATNDLIASGAKAFERTQKASTS
ncbi:putative bifunctional diguanylate cyclase/phosphodiesterase [Cyanobium sp. ATX 6F1]|uniref:putative bifunctional diguanylate cyclase/phosphodiesterase n=1 Tax=unclassified Cyanobium TaxID=2627006 RepID=UPI0020CD65EF|nr:EAL domain-containing protein [Cyanobium sp. ATX 6F1]MCP9917133.1 EAL domain-containing protein [Cyanobium sp. ATX 6F1]